MTHSNLTAPALRGLLAEYITGTREYRKGNRIQWEHQTDAVAFALDGVQALLDRGELVAREELESERRWANQYSDRWFSCAFRLDKVRRFSMVE